MAEVDGPEPEHAWKALVLVNEWVKHAETKSAAVLAFTGVSAGVLFNLVNKEQDPGLVLDAVAVLCGLCLVVAGGCALLALMPRLRVPGRNRAAGAAGADAGAAAADGTAEDLAENDPISLLFFADIARHYEAQGPSYAQVLSALTGNRSALTAQIAHQVHANAGVAHRKYRWAGTAVKALAAALVLLALVAAAVAER